MIYQCKNCFSVYDKTYGDVANGIEINTPFETIINYSCPVCESLKEDFLLITKR
jgi:rubredoxin